MGSDFVGDDLENGNTSEWGTWSATATTFSNLWDSQRRSRVIQTSDTGTLTRAIVGDSSSINQ